MLSDDNVCLTIVVWPHTKKCPPCRTIANEHFSNSGSRIVQPLVDHYPVQIRFKKEGLFILPFSSNLLMLEFSTIPFSNSFRNLPMMSRQSILLMWFTYFGIWVIYLCQPLKNCKRKFYYITWSLVTRDLTYKWSLEELHYASNSIIII